MKSLRDICDLMAACDSMQNEARIVNLAHFVMQTSALPGDICEFGCHSGKTAAVMAALSTKRLWLYDSFEGLPEKSEHDMDCRPDFFPGQLKTHPSLITAYFSQHGLPHPTVVPGWFKDVPQHLLPKQCCFSSIDADFFQSILDALHLIYPRMVTGGVVLVDDYNFSALPGVRRAVDQFLSTTVERLQLLYGPSGELSKHAMFIKA